MAVRGTSVARHQKYAIVRDQADQQFEGERIWCAWAMGECDNYGYTCYEWRVNEAKPGFPVKLARYLFCCEQHREYFKRSHIPGQFGRLAPGTNPRYR